MSLWSRLFPGRGDPRHALGRRGEEEAVRFLERLGYEIVDRNVRTRLGELDLIARDGPVLVFVEVKTRSSGNFALPELSVDARKQRKLWDLALSYIGRRSQVMDCRFDVLGIVMPAVGEPVIHHIQDAFRL